MLCLLEHACVSVSALLPYMNSHGSNRTTYGCQDTSTQACPTGCHKHLLHRVLHIFLDLLEVCLWRATRRLVAHLRHVLLHSGDHVHHTLQHIRPRRSDHHVLLCSTQDQGVQIITCYFAAHKNKAFRSSRKGILSRDEHEVLRRIRSCMSDLMLHVE